MTSAATAAHTDGKEAVQTRLTALLAENPAGFDRILAGFRRDFRPANFTEDTLVQRMARHFWGALRTTRLETGLVEAQMHRATNHPAIQKFAATRGKGYDYDTRLLGVAFETDCGESNAQLKSSRTATAHDAAFIRALINLQKLQDLRETRTAEK